MCFTLSIYKIDFNSGVRWYRVCLPQSHISKIEQGLTDPRLSTVMDMARLLEQELVLVPRHMLTAVKARIAGSGEQALRWVPDEDE